MMSNKKHENRSAKHAEKKQKKSRAAKVVAICLAVVAVALIGFGAYAAWAIQNPGALFAPKKTPVQAIVKPTPSPEAVNGTASPGPAVPTDSVQATPTQEPPPEYEFEQNRVNVLVLGSDSSIERIEKGQNFRTDTMLLVSIDFENNDVDMISLPRDSYVRINGGEQRGKLNAAFVYGGGGKKDGYAYACNTVSWVLGGIPVDYYVGFGMQTVKDVVDAMGGVEYDVDIDFVMNGRTTKAGLQMMDGQKVLDYCRFRKSGRGDIDRVDRQQRVLMALFRQLKSTDQIKNIPKIYDAVASEIQTNMDVMQIASLAYWARNLDLSSIDRHTLEGYGMYIGGTSYWVLNQDAKVALVKEIFGVNISIPAGESYSEIKAMADKLDTGISTLQSLVSRMDAAINSGTVVDTGAIAACNQGKAALITRKTEEVSDAIEALQGYIHLADVVVTPTPGDPNPGGLLGGGGEEAPTPLPVEPTPTPPTSGGLLGG